MLAKLTEIAVPREKLFHVTPAKKDTRQIFADLVDASEMAILQEIESLTDDRVRQAAGNNLQVKRDDVLSGSHAEVVMAAFTHIGKPSLFTDGSFGVYYASFSELTAVSETVKQREAFLLATKQSSCEINMQMYNGYAQQPLLDLRGKKSSFNSRELAKNLRAQGGWGFIYSSLVDQSENVAALRPPAVTIPKPAKQLRYIWNGTNITDVVSIQSLYSMIPSHEE